MEPLFCSFAQLVREVNKERGLRFNINLFLVPDKRVLPWWKKYER
jgi:hypothetical protein